MSLRAPRCGKHPSHTLVGVCAFCLRERLAGFADIECASDAIAGAGYTFSRKKKNNLSPGLALSAQGLRSKPSGNRGVNQPIIANVSTQVSSVVNNVFDEAIASKSLVGAVNSIVHSHSCAAVITGCNKPAIASSVSHAHRNALACAKKTLVEPTHSLKDSPKPKKFRDSDVSNGSGQDEPVCSLEIPAGTPTFSSAKRPSLAFMESNKLPPVDIKMPILENSQHIPVDAKNIKLGQKHSSIECTSPLVGINVQVRVVPEENKMLCTALIDSETSSFNAILGGRGCHPPPEPRNEADMSVKDVEIVLSNVSPSHDHSKKTLSSLFSLDDTEFSVTKVKTKEPRNSVTVKGDAMINGSLSAPVQNVLQAGMMSQRKCRHGSVSERVESSAYLFPVPETGNHRPLSWFSSLFRWRKKKTHPKSVEALMSFSEHNHGWDVARKSWDAPRPSSWEQFRFSSFERPRSSWEPACPSWEGIMRNSDGESVFSGFDFFRENPVEVREGFERKNLQDFAGDLTYGTDAPRSLDSKKAGLKSKPLVPKSPHLEDNERAHTLLSAKPMLMQRDASTQTSPLRSSDATEIFIQQRLHDSHRHHTKAPHAVWSKVWTKTFSNSKWPFKQKHHKDRQQKGVGDAAVVSDEVHDQGNITSGRSSFHEGNNVESSRHLKLTHFDNIEEHEAWDTFCSPLHQARDGGNAVTRLVSKDDGCPKKYEHVNKVRGSNIILENGLPKSYLLPVKGNGIRGKTKQGICAQ